MNPILLFVILISYDNLDETAHNIWICTSIKGINNLLEYLKASARTLGAIEQNSVTAIIINSMIATTFIQ